MKIGELGTSAVTRNRSSTSQKTEFYEDLNHIIFSYPVLCPGIVGSLTSHEENISRNARMKLTFLTLQIQP
jgi:hypothetical protein